MGTIKTTNIQSISGSGTVTLGTSGETFTVPSGVTVNMSSATQTGVGGVNTPAFEAKGSAEQTGVSDNTWTKVTMNTEIFDTAGAYDHSSNYRFTPQVAGKYHVYAMMSLYGGTSDQLQIANLSIYKNGSNYKYLSNNFNNSYPHNEAALYLSTVVDMNGSSDYVELYGRANVLSGNVTFEPQNTLGLFGAYKIVE